jgi:hypothetical protein
VDLNRNATFHWGGVGSSSSACSQTYRGVSAASEPETTALQGLLISLFADRRGPNIGDAAPSTATGTFMTYHSYAGLVLYPWGDVNTPAPNGTKLNALAQKLAAYNGYRVGQPGNVLYNTSGTTDDDLYGRLASPRSPPSSVRPARATGSPRRSAAAPRRSGPRSGSP